MHAVHCRLVQRGPAALLAAAAMATGCGSEPPAPPQLPPPQVTVAYPIQRDVVSYEEFSGRTEAAEVVHVRARVGGMLESMHFTPSRVVRRGTLLFTIEQAPYVAARNAALANVRTVEANLDRARSDLARLEQAMRTNAVSAQEVDRARADVRQFEANLLGEQARLEQAELELSYTRIRSPIRGLIGRNTVSVGNVVGTQSEPLATVMRIDPVHAYFDASEILLLELLDQTGRTLGSGSQQEAAIHLGLSNEAGWPHEGVIDYVDNTVDPGTGTIQVRGTFPNPERKLFPGLFARLRIPGPVRPDALLVVERALGADLGGRFVLVVGADVVVELRHVEVGAAEGELRVRQGLTTRKQSANMIDAQGDRRLPVQPACCGSPAGSCPPKTGARSSCISSSPTARRWSGPRRCSTASRRC